MARGVTSRDAGGNGGKSQIDLMREMAGNPLVGEAKKEADPVASLDRWAKAGLKPPQFIKELYEANLPDQENPSMEVLTNPIDNFNYLQRAISIAIHDVAQIVDERQVKNLSVRLRSNREKRPSPPFIEPFDSQTRLDRLKEGQEFITNGGRMALVTKDRQTILWRSGNLLLHQCMGPDWMADFMSNKRYNESIE